MAVSDWPDGDDPEGALVEAVRRAVGAETPIGVVLDLHSDTTDRLLAAASFTMAYNEEPHRDLFERGEEAAALLLRIVAGLRVATARVRAPMLLPAINMATDEGPMAELHARRAELERTPGVIDVSIHGGFYGSDQPEAGFSVTAITDGDRTQAETAARTLALEAWEMRRAFIVPLVTPAEAVRLAREAAEPIGLIDEADDPAGGGACDSVLLLRAMLEGGVVRGGVSTIFDEAAAQACAEAGVGARVSLDLGGRLDPRHAPPLGVEGAVRAIRTGPMPIDSWSGKTYDPGVVAALDVAGVIVVITARKMVTENIDIFEPLGFDVRAMEAVAFKGLGLHVRQALRTKIRRFVAIDGDGCTHPDVTRLGPFRRLERPCWPFDPDTRFS
jgi:microcystin degradation protein MlrC